MNREEVNLSRRLSLVLRHHPASAGISLDREGWADADAVIRGLRTSREALERVVSEDDKKRFEWGKGGERIRARQGHSVEVELGYTPQSPPELLYHGTVAKFLVSIMAGGLLKGERHHVHLSADVETATRVGRRRGTPVIIVVDSSRMAAAGVEFFNTPNGVWLTDHVPPEYLRFPS